MKKILFILFITFQCFISFNVNAVVIFDQMISLIQSGKYEEAADVWSKTETGSKKEGYRMVAFNLSHHNKTGENTKLIKKYYNKSCYDYEYTRCVDYGIFLEKKNQYKDAENLYLNLEKRHHDQGSLERLYLLYRNPNWTGKNLEKSKYWWDKYFVVMEKRKEKRNIALKKYGLNK